VRIYRIKTRLIEAANPDQHQNFNHFYSIILASAYHVWSTSVNAFGPRFLSRPVATVAIENAQLVLSQFKK